MSRRRRSKEIARRMAGKDHAVVTIEGGRGSYRRTPCEQCPWRKDSPVGAFPADAYRHSAGTAHDASFTQFACHMSGIEKPATCAGFLLANAQHNLGARINIGMGIIDPREISSPVPLYESYRAMAEANGVPADDPALALCRANGERTKP